MTWHNNNSQVLMTTPNLTAHPNPK